MSKSTDKLTQIFDLLPEHDQKTLLDFAEFLQSRAPQPKTKITEPLDISRPDEESVIAAIKRLNQTHPMVERSSVFRETSDLMMQHMMHGKSATDVIDELQNVFHKKFKMLVEGDQ